MIEKIIGQMGDEQSKEIFELRLLYSKTGDYKYIRKIVEMTNPAKTILRIQQLYHGKKFLIWGADFLGKILLKSFPDVSWEAFIDSRPKEEEIEGIPIYSKQKFAEKYAGHVVVIASVGHYEEIMNELLYYGVPDKYIVNIGYELKQMFNRQYFDLPALYHVEEEVFVDAGFYDGISAANFILWAKNKYNKIIGFEPDYINYRKYKENAEINSKLQLFNACIWSEESLLGFNQTGQSSSTINNTKGCNVNVQAHALDNIITEYPISFIKMDIEGAEKAALLGAKKTIQTYKPKLAICVYHKKEDILEIPNMILSMNPEYRLFLRHYSLRDAETVLYAI